MDSKILWANLLLGAFCLWSTEASPLEGAALDYSSQAVVDLNAAKGYPEDDNPKAGVEAKSAAVASHMAKEYANKAKALNAESSLLNQLAKDRGYYYREYTKLAEDAKRKSIEYEQLSNTEGSRIAGHLQRQKEWESKAREAETQCKDEDLKAQQLYSNAQELYRNSAVAYSAASIAEALAYGYQRRADRLTEFIREAKQRAENLLNDARKHYTAGKEDENRAAAEKVKAHQQAEDSQKHHSASRAYQQEAVKTRLSSRNNMMKYIQYSLLAERTRNYAREENLKSELEEKQANENARMSEQSGAIYKILSREYAYNAARAKHEETRSLVMSESSREAVALAGEGGALLKLANAGAENPDEEEHQRLTVYPADDPVKYSANDDKESYQFSGEGL